MVKTLKTKLKLKTKQTGQINPDEIDERELAFENETGSLVIKDLNSAVVRIGGASEGGWENKVWWDDVPMVQILEDLQTQNFSFSQSKQQKIHFFFENNGFWIKRDWQAGKTYTIIVRKKQQQSDYDNPNYVFTFYDNFENGLSKWTTHNNPTVENGVLTVNNSSGVKSIQTLPNNVYIEYRVKANASSARGGVRFADNDNLGYKEWDKWLPEILFWDSSTFWVDGGGADKSWKTYDTNWRMQKLWYRDGLFDYWDNGDHYNETRNNGVKNYYIYIFSSSGGLSVDWIRVRKYYDENDFNIQIISQTNNEIVYSVQTTKDYPSTEIFIQLPNGWLNENEYIEVYTQDQIPDIKIPIFRKGDRSYFRVQIPHKTKIGGELHFHLHTLIPNDSYNGKKVHFRIKLVKFTTYSTSNEIVIDKVFEINVDQTPKEVIMNFGKVTTVDEVSQIVLGYVERVDDSADTLPDPLPVLFADFHYEIDSPGSHTEFNK